MTAGREVAICVGGPRDGWAYFADELDRQADLPAPFGRAPYRRTSEHRTWNVKGVVFDGVVFEYVPVTPEQARDEGIARTAAANPEDTDRVFRCIRQVAEQRAELSANDVRHLHPGITKTKVIGAAYQRAIKAGLIVPTGFVKSQGGTANAHHIRLYRSRVCRGAVA